MRFPPPVGAFGGPQRPPTYAPQSPAHGPGWDPVARPPQWVAKKTDARPVIRPGRPVYREPFRVRTSRVAFGFLTGLLWTALVGAQAFTAREFAWLTIFAAALAWLLALVLARFGDRGVAAGVASAAAVGVAIVAVIVIVRWTGGHWLLW
jgi:hypothetical protein